MRILSTVCLSVIVSSVFLPMAQAQDVDTCDAFPTVLNRYAELRDMYFDGDEDLDNDGLPDRASLKLIEAVGCLNANSDMADATYNAFNMNLAVFDSEDPELISELDRYRRTIAMLMLISADMQSRVNNKLGGLLTGTYERVQCAGEACTPDPVEDVSPREMVNTLVIAARDTDEPYSGTGDLDMDGTDNVTEWNNVVAKSGGTDDFVVAATSPNLNGTEDNRTPGGGGGGGCFVATAAFGTPLADEVDVLRDVRDQILLNTAAGTAFVDTYYRLSPGLADIIAKHEALRMIARVLLIPILFAAQHTSVAIGLLVLAITAVFARRRNARSISRVDV